MSYNDATPNSLVPTISQYKSSIHIPPCSSFYKHQLAFIHPQPIDSIVGVAKLLTGIGLIKRAVCCIYSCGVRFMNSGAVCFMSKPRVGCMAMMRVALNIVSCRRRESDRVERRVVVNCGRELRGPVGFVVAMSELGAGGSAISGRPGWTKRLNDHHC
jgi:hypothetical protein